jgi:outer membrane receptor protein involved in Fe transport
VTGSAIERKETTTPAPVSVIDREELDAAGLVSVGDILQNLPAQSNGINVQFNNGGDGSTRIDLRGLGADRTLVLVNGRRHVPGGTGANASVDLNAIPLAIIKRVEVLKDGASAVYGSDAIGGVVNIITRDDFEGAEGSVYTASTQRGDGVVIDASVVTGQASRRGNVVLAAGYSDQRPIYAGDRDYAEVTYNRDFGTGQVRTSGSGATPNGYVYDPVPKDGPRAGQPLCGSSTPLREDVDGNGELDDFEQDVAGCTPDGRGGFRLFNGDGSSDTGEGDLYNFQPENYLLTPERRYNAYSSGNYRFHERVGGFFEASYTNRKSVQRLAPEPLFTETEGIPVSADSIYNPTGQDLNFVARRMLEAGPRKFSQNLDTFRIVTGLNGRLPSSALDGWKWEASFNYGRTDGTSLNQGRLVRSRVRNAIGPSFRDNGVPRCGTPDNVIPDCVPLDLLGGEGSITKQMLDYITYTGTQDGFTQQRTWLGQASGPVVKTPWNGDVVLAFGADYREEAGGQLPDPLTASGDTTGNKADPTFGDYNVLEAFGELSIVPVTGEEWARWLEINLAGRVVDYNTFGSAFTWKAGALWRVAGGAAFRGTYSTAFRAPNIGDLYSGQQDAFPGVADPCAGPFTNPNTRANCIEDVGGNGTVPDNRAQLPSIIGGNPALDPETARVWTGGVVYEPDYVEGLGLSVDYFHIQVDNAIQQATASVLLSNCYNQAPGSRADCDKIIRDPTSRRIVQIIDTQTNIGGARTDGVDFNVNYEHSHPQVGRFRHNLEGTWLHEYDALFPDRTVHGVGVYDLGVFPRWKFNFSTMWGLKGVGLGVNAYYVHEFKECAANDCSSPDGPNAGVESRKVEASITGDAFASYQLKSPAGTSTLTLGVNNVTDREPPVIYNGFYATSDASAYDFLGRYFYARFTQLF